MHRLLLLLLLFAAPAHAEWLPDLPRAVTRTDTASRDAPVSELSYDGRGHALLGTEFGVLRRQVGAWQFHWLIGALTAADNAQSRWPVPMELARWEFGSAFVVQLPWRGDGGAVEFAIGLARQQAKTIDDFRLPDAVRPDAIPFAGNGYLVDFEVAGRRRVGPLQATARLGDRVHLPGLALLFGARTAAAVLSDDLADGLSHQPTLDVTLRWPISPQWQPVWALHGELFVPVDGFVRTRGYVRSLLGVALVGSHAQVLPFVAIDVGAGPGQLLNREELRLAVGMRYVPN
jgi:hypothetical protein